MKELPIYKAFITDDESLGVDYVAIVDVPAIQRNFITLNEDKKPLRFVAQGEKRILSGPLMIADLPIYRNSKEKGEYYVMFDKPTIEGIVTRFAKNQNHNNVNIMHDNTQRMKGVYMIESFIIDRERGVSPPAGFEDLTDGSWFGSYKVEDDKVWNDFIKSGELKGFSVEGFFLESPKENENDDEINELIDAMESMMQELKKIN